MSDWIEWKGGECPVPPGTKVDVKFRSGNVYDGENAASYSWRHCGVRSDIVAYRVVGEQPAPKNDGGPAFPFANERPDAPAGMTLRDYFAAVALPALISAMGQDVAGLQRAMKKAGTSDPQALFARNAYAVADAMLAAREAQS